MNFIFIFLGNIARRFIKIRMSVDSFLEISYTPEVKITQETSYLIRINGAETFFAETEDDCKLIIDSIAAENVRKLQDDWVKVFRLDAIDGKKITISTQALGRMVDGAIYDVMTIDFVPVHHAKLLRGRLERQDRYEVSLSNSQIVDPEFRLIL